MNQISRAKDTLEFLKSHYETLKGSSLDTIIQKLEEIIPKSPNGKHSIYSREEEVKVYLKIIHDEDCIRDMKFLDESRYIGVKFIFAEYESYMHNVKEYWFKQKLDLDGRQYNVYFTLYGINDEDFMRNYGSGRMFIFSRKSGYPIKKTYNVYNYYKNKALFTVDTDNSLKECMWISNLRMYLSY